VLAREISYHGERIWVLDDHKYYDFYDSLQSGKWEIKTFDTLRKHLDNNTVYVDIGGWIGILPFWAEKISKKVIVVEPDPFCVETLKFLQQKNGSNIKLFQAAFAGTKTVEIHDVKGFGSSETSILKIGGDRTVTVPGIDVDEMLSENKEDNIFVKIDIEGHEYNMIDHIKKFVGYNLLGLQLAIHPALYLRSLGDPSLLTRWDVALKTWSLRNVVPGFTATPDFKSKQRFFRYCFFRVLWRSKGTRGRDLLFIPK
jgi:FkbM family methyltransferase